MRSLPWALGALSAQQTAKHAIKEETPKLLGLLHALYSVLSGAYTPWLEVELGRSQATTVGNGLRQGSC